jgi:hypothetical protein
LEASERHAEAILKLSKDHAQSILKVYGESSQVIAENTSSFKNLIYALSGSPCLVGKLGRNHQHEANLCDKCGKVHWKYGPCHPEESPEP